MSSTGSSWPVVAVTYKVGDPKAPVAVCALTSERLMDPPRGPSWSRHRRHGLYSQSWNYENHTQCNNEPIYPLPPHLRKGVGSLPTGTVFGSARREWS